MGRIDHRAGFRWKAVAAALAASLLPPAALAQLPQVAIPGYPVDERLSLDGGVIRAADASHQEALLARETARVRSEQDYVVAPAIWKIADADTTIYIFGTVHSLPPGFRWRNPGLEAVIARSDSLLLESADDDPVPTFLEGVADGSALPPLIERVSPAYRARLAALMDTLPDRIVAHLDSMPTWIAALGISYLRDLMTGDIPGQGADAWLEQLFRARGRPVESIEDSRSVVASLNAIPESAQARMLEAALDTPLRSRAVLHAPAHAWARGEVGPDSPLIIIPESLDPAAAMADPLLARRNAAWVDYLLDRMDRPGTVLFAAGAGHFVGPGSVIEMLQARGMLVERVQ